MTILNQFPQGVQQYLVESFGVPVAINKLNGIKSDGGCYRLRFSNTSVILKQMTEPQEYQFYTECTQFMKQLNKHIPILYWSYKQEKAYWIVLEDVPSPLPKERWFADSHLLEVLFHFHLEMWGKSLPLRNHYIPKWNDKLTCSVLELVSDKISNLLEPLLFEIQEQSQRLFKPYCWINGDTNPTNWGIRKDGTIVLFDWERISCGSPAIDLAITIPGLGTSDNSIELLIVNRYFSMWSKLSKDFPLTEQKLLQEIKLAKLWSIVEFLDNNWTSLQPEAFNHISKGFIQKTYELMKLLNDKI
jgi:hypothetical protein